MSSRTASVLAAICGVVGPTTLVASFAINPAPPAGATIAQLADFARRNHDRIVVGGWLQGIGSLLIVAFALSMVHFAGARQTLAGSLTKLSATTILVVSLVEVTFYLAAVQAATTGDLTSAVASNNLIKAVQHVFLIAPALLLPFGVVLLDSRVLPRVFAYLALALGSSLQVLGLVGLFHALQPVIDFLLIVQAMWFVAAAIALAIRARASASDGLRRGARG